MPIFEYRPSQPHGCSHCENGFELLHKRGEAELEQCPACGQTVHRVASPPSLSKTSPSLAPENLERHGFTQYRKSGERTYEKTAGAGPRTIRDE